MKNLLSILKSVLKSESVKFNYNRNQLYKILSANVKSDLFTIRLKIIDAMKVENSKFEFKTSKLAKLLTVLKDSKKNAEVHNRLLSCSNYTVVASKVKDTEVYDISFKFDMSNVVDAANKYLKMFGKDITNVALKVETLQKHINNTTEATTKLKSEKSEIALKAESLKDKKEHEEYYLILVDKVASLNKSINKNNAVKAYLQAEIKVLTVK